MSNGQIFMAVIPSDRRSCANSSARSRNAFEVVVVMVVGRQSPIVGALALILAHVGGAGAGVVGADPVPREAAEQLRDRLSGHLAEISHSAMSSAELPRISAPVERNPT